MINLKESELNRLSKDGIEYLINFNKQRLNVWSIPRYEKEEIKKELKQLYLLLEKA
jgi:hypothetical protein